MMPLWGQERGRQSVRLEVGRSQEGPRWVWEYRVDVLMGTESRW